MSYNKNTSGINPGDIIVGKIGKDGIPTTDLMTATWTNFLNGTWTTQKPTSPGIYPIANRRGKLVGEALFKKDCCGELISVSHQNWDGWYYSKAMPLLPNRPSSVWKEDKTILRLVKNKD